MKILVFLSKKKERKKERKKEEISLCTGDKLREQILFLFLPFYDKEKDIQSSKF